MDQNKIEREREPEKSNIDKHDYNEKEKLEEGLPMKDSPYLQCEDLEDYKKKGYGAEGHLQPKPGRGAGASTDAPTLSGGSVTSEAEALAKEAIKR